MFEELAHDYTQMRITAHEKIFMLPESSEMDPARFQHAIERLLAAAEVGRRDNIGELFAELKIGYRPAAAASVPDGLGRQKFLKASPEV